MNDTVIVVQPPAMSEDLAALAKMAQRSIAESATTLAEAARVAQPGLTQLTETLEELRRTSSAQIRQLSINFKVSAMPTISTADLTGLQRLAAAVIATRAAAGFSEESTPADSAAQLDEIDEPVQPSEIYDLLTIMTKALIALPDRMRTPSVTAQFTLLMAALTLLLEVIKYARGEG